MTPLSTTGAWTEPELAALAEHSVRAILELQHPSGAFPASPTFSAYVGYSWFRDGAFIADGVSAWGEVVAASRFHDWCAGILGDRRDQVEQIVADAAAGTPAPDSRMLPTRFTFDGREGDDEWWDFQLDGYGTWLWALGEHVRRHDLDPAPWSAAIDLAVDYLLSSWDRPCFDWWEEHAEQVHVSTLGCIVAGLLHAPGLDSERGARAQAVAAEILAVIESRGTVDGHLVKWLGSREVDASLAALVHPLGIISGSSPVGRATTAAVDSQLCVEGGVHRYLLDTFYGGGQWPLLSCFLGLAAEASGDRPRALALLRWAASTSTALGDLPEQVDDHLLFPEREQEWIERWGGVATPLLWSHAMFVRLHVELGLPR